MEYLERRLSLSLGSRDIALVLLLAMSLARLALSDIIVVSEIIIVHLIKSKTTFRSRSERQKSDESMSAFSSRT